MNWIDRVYRIQIDVTSHCNARCPGCIRTTRYTEDGIEQGNKRFNDLELSHFDEDMWNELCTAEYGFRTFPNLNQLVFNGTWGDPCMHPKLPEMLKTFCDIFPNVTINMHTNGGAQSAEWWHRLGKILSTQPHSVIVALDGLEDTHSLYRRGTNFNTIIRNVQSFVDGGGSPRWMMTVFDHNIHQIEKARELAKKYEFRRFQSRRSHTKNMHVEVGDEVYDITTNNVTSTHYINEKAHGPNRRVPFINIPERPSLEEVDSQCEWYNDGSFQIDPWGYVLPCCHMAHLPVTTTSKHTIDQEDTRNFITHNDTVLENLNLKRHTLADIITGEWFTNTLENQVESACLTICQKECGVKNKHGTL